MMNTDVKAIVEAFRAKKILVRCRFGAMTTFLRAIFGTRPEMEQFIAALDEIVPSSDSKSGVMVPAG